MYYFYQNEIINFIIDIIKKRYPLQKDIEEDDVFIYILLRYFIENSYDIKSLQLNYTNEINCLFNIFFENNPSLSQYITNIISIKSNELFKIKTINKEIIDINYNESEINNLILNKYRVLLTKQYKSSLKNKVSLFEYIIDIIEILKNKIFLEEKYKQLSINRRKNYLMYRLLIMVDDIYFEKPYILPENSKENIFQHIYEQNFKFAEIKEIKEKDIEAFLVKHIEVINKDYVVIGRQIRIEDGVIDILCQDKKLNYIIIELKNKQNKSIVWQSLYYPKEIRKHYNIKLNKSIKFIAFCPDFKYPIKSVLKDIKNVELLSYEVVIDDNNKIVDLLVTNETNQDR